MSCKTNRGVADCHDVTVTPAEGGNLAEDINEATLAALRAELRHAREKYREHTQNTHHDWLRAASEELGECSKTMHNGGMSQEEMDHLREEILQLATTALNWADRGDFSPTHPGQRP